ncbi:hypothetical protein SH1V18_44470 [Vallitalea longa]|uniref:CARDB domain-containing protein n=1 Tax=Vallitalea longa TaxID=2936439 RepID=A0A9W6DHV5_9FIRM|nr:CARDB domain-containing protein [Vallitalea longa]GKX31967.1 hypothetical protein SH1V18_44470 [Vallitalea longa]
MKKFLVYICALVICFNVVGVDISASDEGKSSGDKEVTPTTDITINNYDTDEDEIYSGKEFDLTIHFNRPSNAEGKNIFLNVQSSSFIVMNKSLPINIGTTGDKYTIPMKCTGSDGTINITFSYTDKEDDTNTITSVNTISIDLANTSSSGGGGGGTDSNPDRYNTELVVEDQKIPTITAGSNVDLSFELKNAGFYTAKNIKVEFLPTEEIDFETNSILNLVNNIPQLRKNETAKLKYSFYLNGSTPAKTYKCQIKYSYYPINAKQPVTTTQDLFIKVRKGIPDVDLKLTDIAYTPSVVKPGEKVQLSFTVNNNYGSSNVKSVDVSIKDDENAKNYFTIMNGINSCKITNLSPDKEGKKVTFDLFASSELKKGSYPVTIALKYKDSSNTEKTVEKKLYLMSEGSEDEDKGNTEVTVKNIVSPTGQINYNQSFDISFDIINTGEEKAENFYVSVNGDEEVVPMSQNINTINELEVGATKHLTYKFKPTEEATTKNHLIKIEIKGKTEEEFPTMSQYVGVYVKAKEEEKDDKNNTSKPIIIIDNFTLNPDICNAGENFDVDISFKNTHKTKTVKNIKISLAAEENQDTDKEKSGSVFTPVDTSSTFFIDEIKPQQSIGQKLTMFTIPYAASKVHNLNLDIYYEYTNEDETLTETIKDTIPVTVVQPSNFITNEFKIPEQTFVGQPFSISLEISNTGKTTLDNFTVEIEGFEATNNRAYLGNLERGNTTYYDTDLSSNEEGEITGNIIFSYTGPDGKPQSRKQEIKTTVMAMEIDNNAGMEAGNMDNFMPPEEAKKSNTKLIIIIAAVAVVAVVVVVIIVRKKIKKKKELNFDE